MGQINSIDDVRKLYREKAAVATEEDAEKIENLDFILECDDIFFKLDFETIIGILDFLGVPEDGLIDAYLSLTSIENYNKNVYVTISNRM